jgi:hypothetical protein
VFHQSYFDGDTVMLGRSQVLALVPKSYVRSLNGTVSRTPRGRTISNSVSQSSLIKLLLASPRQRTAAGVMNTLLWHRIVGRFRKFTCQHSCRLSVGVLVSRRGESFLWV